VQMTPSCDQTGVRILLSVSPRQSPSSAILFEISSDADWPSLASDFFMSSVQVAVPLEGDGNREGAAVTAPSSWIGGSR